MEQRVIAPRDGYGDDVCVWMIEDGERHYYAACATWEAIKCHWDIMDLDYYGHGPVTISYVAPDTRIAVHFDDESELKEFGPTFARSEDGQGRPVAETTAAEWAAHYADKLPRQISSTCF